MIRAKKIAQGEYEYKGCSISKDDFEQNLWWINFPESQILEDCRTLKDAKTIIDNVA